MERELLLTKFGGHFPSRQGPSADARQSRSSSTDLLTHNPNVPKACKMVRQVSVKTIRQSKQAYGGMHKSSILQAKSKEIKQNQKPLAE